jgi:hypothetical protein
VLEDLGTGGVSPEQIDHKEMKDLEADRVVTGRLIGTEPLLTRGDVSANLSHLLLHEVNGVTKMLPGEDEGFLVDEITLRV